MDQPTQADFEQWANSPITALVVRHLLEEQADYEHIDTTLALKAGSMDDSSLALTLERIGLDSAMRASVTEGIRMFTDFDRLLADMQDKKLISTPKEKHDE